MSDSAPTAWGVLSLGILCSIAILGISRLQSLAESMNGLLIRLSDPPGIVVNSATGIDVQEGKLELVEVSSTSTLYSYTDPDDLFSITLHSPPWRLKERLGDNHAGCHCVFLHFAEWADVIVIFHPESGSIQDRVSVYASLSTQRPKSVEISGSEAFLYEDVPLGQAAWGTAAGRVIIIPSRQLLFVLSDTNLDTGETVAPEVDEILTTLRLNDGGRF